MKERSPNYKAIIRVASESLRPNRNSHFGKFAFALFAQRGNLLKG
jgi:hypothetical protein